MSIFSNYGKLELISALDKKQLIYTIYLEEIIWIPKIKKLAI